MTAGVIAAIVAGVLIVGAVKDRMSDNPGFKHAQHEKFNDPASSEN